MSDPRTALLPVLNHIVTHPNPHLDELATIWEIEKFGTRGFRINGRPGIHYMSWSEARTFVLENEGTIILGMGGGEFDDHGRSEVTCTAKLMAKYLGVNRLPELRAILKRVLDSDTLEGEDAFNLPRLIKSQNRHGVPPDQIYKWVADVLDSLFEDGRDFHLGCPKDFSDSGRIMKIAGLDVGFVTSGFECMPAWLRETKGANICVVRRSSGRCSIFCDGSENSRKVITAIALGLLGAEQELLCVQDKRRDREARELETMITVGTDGYIPGAEHWFFFRRGGMILNGSESHPDAEPTLLNKAQIRDVVTAAIQAISQPKVTE
ncbi:MAG: hypothetical protein V1716_01680 [Candidatus Uhrbacteria bacterium]